MSSVVAPGAQQQEETKGIRALLRATVERWAPFVPKGVDPEEVVQAAYLETKKNPKLLNCAPESILQAVTRILQLGLQVGVTAFLVPFKGVCTMVVGKDGVIELIISTGVVRSVRARCIYKNEPYQFIAGTQLLVEHRPIADPDARGELVGAYVVFRLAHQEIDAFEMSAKEIEAIRQKYSKQWREGPLPGWYCEKTVIIHGAKQLPKNPRMARLTAIAERLGDADDLGLEPEHRVASVPAPAATAPVIDAPRGIAAPAMEAVAVPARAEAVPVAPGSVNDHTDADRGVAPLEYQDDSDLVD